MHRHAHVNAFRALLQDAADLHGDRPALVEGARSVRYAELPDLVGRIAASWSSTPKQRIALLLDNGADALLSDLAGRWTGATVASLPPYFTPEQRARALQDLAPDLILLPAAQAASWPRRARPCPGLESAWIVEPELRAPRSTSTEGSPACITYTSGSTGEPKGIALDESLLLQVAGSLAAAVDDLDIRRHLAVLPCATLLEQVAGVYAPLLRGVTIECCPLRQLGYDGASGLDPLRFVQRVARSEPHSIILVPQLLEALVSVLEQTAHRIDSLRFVAVGGARVGESLLQRSEDVGLPVFEGYGMTECGSVLTLNRAGGRRRGSVGRPLSHVRLRVAGDGEILVAGAGRGQALRCPAEQDDAADDWWPTGDLGRLDDDGFLYIDGRRRNVFITAFGRNVSPEWIENELCAEPIIAQAYVEGEALPVNVAVLVPHRADCTDAELAAVVASANARLPSYARVGAWLRAEPFSAANGLLTGNGRLRRDTLRARFAAEVRALGLQPPTRIHPVPIEEIASP